MASDGIKIPIVISGAALLGMLFEAGVFWNKSDNQQKVIDRLELQLSQREDTSVKERLAVVESDVKSLAHDMEQNSSSHQAMWQAIGKKADR